MNRSKPIEKGDLQVRLQQPKSYEMGVQVLRCVHREVPSKSAIRKNSSASRGGVSRTGQTEGESGSGGSFVFGPRGYDGPNSTAACGFASARLHQGQECHSAGSRFHGRDRSFKGYHSWVRGYIASTVGIDERTIREYIRRQEENHQKLDQQRLF